MRKLHCPVKLHTVNGGSIVIGRIEYRATSHAYQQAVSRVHFLFNNIVLNIHWSWIFPGSTVTIHTFHGLSVTYKAQILIKLSPRNTTFLRCSVKVKQVVFLRIAHMIAQLTSFQVPHQKIVMAYIDDILIYFPNYHSHVTHVKQVLTRLKDNKLFIKCEKFESNVSTENRVSMDQSKVEAVYLQNFLGFENFYRRFIHGFSLIAAPLMAKTETQETKTTWKQGILFSITLTQKDPLWWRLMLLRVALELCYASIWGISPVAYFYQETYSCCNYNIGNQELLVVKLAWKNGGTGWKEPFVVCPHQPQELEVLKDKKQTRWALFFTQFQFTIAYRPGSSNTKADALYC